MNTTLKTGWGAGEQCPECVRELVDRAERTGRTGPAVFGYRITRAGEPNPEQNLTNLSSCTPPTLFDEAAYVALVAQRGDAERVEVLFFNPAARRGENSPHGVNATGSGSLAEFLRAVADSLHPETGDRTSCEWAVLTLTK